MKRFASSVLVACVLIAACSSRGGRGGGGGGGTDAGRRDAGPIGADDAGGRDAGSLTDAGRRDAGARDAGPRPRDAGPPDSGRPAGMVTAMFPTMSASTCNVAGSCGTLGAGGGGSFFQAGDNLTETVTLGAPSISRLSLDFDMDDHTAGCAVGATHTFDVSVNSRRVGAYSFTTPAGASGARRIDVVETYSFPAIAGTGAGNQYAIELRATSEVCSGGSSWNWFPGGTATGTSP